MKTRAAVLREISADWSVEEIELDEPKAGEILVKTTAAGMCHSDEHAHDGTMPVPLPIAPSRSATTVSAPMHMPPKAAAGGMYRFSVWTSACA